MPHPIRTERRGPVLEVTIDRPKANAIDAPTSRVMGEAFAAFRDDPELRVAILTGAGEKFFCPGWDLKAAAAGESPDADRLDTLAAAYAAVGRFPDAVATARRAKTLADAGESPDLAREIAERLALYEHGEPYRAD